VVTLYHNITKYPQQKKHCTLLKVAISLTINTFPTANSLKN